MSPAPRRPALRYHGGKWKLAPWILPFFPAHQTYCEPFGGGASVLLQKPRSAAEIYNDLDEQVVRVFRVLQDPVRAEQLRRRLIVTPFARLELERCYEAPLESLDDVEAAARVIILAFMGVGSDGSTRRHRTGFRGLRKNGTGTTAATDWGGWPAQLPAFLERLRGVLFECRPAQQVMAVYDNPSTLFYVDPPYVLSARAPRGGGSKGYRFELTDEDHRALAQQLHGLAGMVVLSGYRSPLYAELFGDWQFHGRAHRADRARAVVEGLWLNPAAAAATRVLSLF